MNNSPLLVNCEHIFGNPDNPQARHASDATITAGPESGEVLIQASAGYRILLKFTDTARRALVRMLIPSRSAGRHTTDIEYEEA